MFSFVIPVYNTKKEYLDKCIKSLLDAAYDDSEIIIIDDASLIECSKVCDEYSLLDSRVKVIHKQINEGVSKARNTGIRESLGDWIVFVDADDWVETDICATLSKYVQKENDIIMFSAYRELVGASIPFGNAEEIFSYSGQNEISELCDGTLKQSLSNVPPRFSTVKYCWGKAFRRDFLIENNLFFSDLNYCEDIVFSVAAVKAAENVIQIPDRLYHYRSSLSSVVNSFRKNALNEQMSFVEQMKELLGERDSFYFVVLLSMQICISRYLFNSGNKNNYIKKRSESICFFSQYPYSDVFKNIQLKKLKRIERYKAYLIKYKLYYLYYLGTKLRITKRKKYE